MRNYIYHVWSFLYLLQSPNLIRPFLASRPNSMIALFQVKICPCITATPTRSDYRGTWKKDMNYSQGKPISSDNITFLKYNVEISIRFLPGRWTILLHVEGPRHRYLRVSIEFTKGLSSSDFQPGQVSGRRSETVRKFTQLIKYR